MRRLDHIVLIAFLVFLPLLTTSAQPSAGCTEAGADLPAALQTAQASASRCLHIPAGDYPITIAGGTWLNVTADNLELFGDGEGKTILHATGNLTLTQSLYPITLHGQGQHIHDLTIRIDPGYHSTYEIGGLQVYAEASHALIERVEVVGGYSGNGGNGFGIGTYRNWQFDGGAQYVTIRDTYVHDSPATAIGVNSSNNLLLNNHIKTIGTTSLQHGFYAQGGGNFYQGNVVENASGYSFHGNHQVPSLDGSGDRFIGNLSLNPGAGHLVINSTPNGSNPLVPVGAALTRYATISDNTFRNTAGHRSGGVWCNGVPCVIDGNTLEDVYGTNGSGWIEDSGGSIITNNSLMTLVAPDGATNYSMIRATGNAGATIANNRLVNGQYGGGIVVSGARHTITGNTILLTSSGSQALYLSGDMLLVSGNRLESTGGAYVLAIALPLTNLMMSGNYLKRNGDLCNLNLAGVTGGIYNNVYDGTFRYTGGITVVR